MPFFGDLQIFSRKREGWTVAARETGEWVRAAEEGAQKFQQAWRQKDAIATTSITIKGKPRNNEKTLRMPQERPKPTSLMHSVVATTPNADQGVVKSVIHMLTAVRGR